MNFAFTTGGGPIAAGTRPSSSFISLQSGNFALCCRKSFLYVEQYCTFPQRSNGGMPKVAWIAVSGNPVIPNTESPPELSRSIKPSEIPGLLAMHGLDYLHRLSGQYIIVLVFPEAQRAICIRDQAGSRACYWAQQDSRCVIADSASAVSRLAGLALIEDSETIAEWLMPAATRKIGKSAFDGVVELQPGERLTFEHERVKLQRAPIDLAGTAHPPNQVEWVNRFRAHLETGVINCLPATGNPALMLSGGLDSGPAAAVAASRLQADGRDLEIVSWYIDAIPEASEWSWIEQLSGHIRARLHPVCGDDHLPFSQLNPEMIDSDFPMYNPFRPVVLACYRRAAELGSHVIINGASGDSLYPHSRFALHDALRRGHLVASARILKARTKKYGVLGLRRDPAIRYLGSRLLGPRGQPARPEWLTQAAIDSLTPTEIWPPEAQDHPYPQYITQLFGPRAASAIAHENRFSERFGLQRRDPYTDFELLKLMVNMPHSISNGIGTTKWVMREAMRGILPEDFRTKPRTGNLSKFHRHGYQANLTAIRDLLSTNRDWQEWVRKDYLENVLKHTRPETKDALLVGKCIGYTLWRQKLKEQRVSKP